MNLSTKQYYSVFETKLFAVIGLLLIAFLWLAPSADGAITRIAALILILSLFLARNVGSVVQSELKWLVLANWIYVATAFLSLLNNQDWHEAGGRLERYIPFLLSPLLLSSMLMDARALYRYLFIGLILAAFTAGGLSIYQGYILGIDRVGEGTGLNQNAFGHISSMILLVLVVIASHSNSRMQKVLAIFASLFAVVAVIGSGSRGGFFAMLAGLALLLIHHLIYATPKQKKHVMGFAALVLLMTLLMIGFNDSWQQHISNMTTQVSAFLSGSDNYTSISARFLLWEAGIKSGLANLWIGTGVGDTELDYDYWASIGAIPNYGHSIFVVHNIFIDCFATTGILGLLAMLVAVFIVPMQIFIRSLKVRSSDQITKLTALAGLALLANNVVYGMPHSWLYTRELPYSVILLTVLLVLTTHQRRTEK